SIVQHRIGACAAGFSLNAVDAAGNPTCTNTLYTAGNGLAVTNNQFTIDPTTTQARVTGTCAVGASVTAIAADGSVTCGTATRSVRINNAEATGSIAYADLGTTGPSVSVAIPASGTALVTVTALITLNGAAGAAMGFAAGTTAAADTQALIQTTTGTQASAT